MPSRRSVLLGAATVGSAAAAGCLGVLGDDLPVYADRLHDPAAMFPTERHGFGSLDVRAVRDHRPELPRRARDALDRLDRRSESVSLSDVDRLVALGYGDPTAGRAGLTLVARGSFDPAAVRREIGAARSSLVTEAGERGGFRLYGYAPSVFADLRRFRGPDQSEPPDLSFGLAVRESTLIGGAVLDAGATGLDAVRAAVDAPASDGDGVGLADDQDAADLLATVGDRSVAAGVSSATLDALRERVEDSDARALLETAAAAGVGYALGDETLRVSLVVEPSAFDGPEDVRDLAERLAETPEGDAVEVESVGVTRRGRVAFADLDVSTKRLVALADAAPDPLDEFELSSD